MDFFKATNGRQWYVSVDGGNTFERCQREPFLADKLAAPADDAPLHEEAENLEEASLSREQLEQRGFSISRLTRQGASP